MGGRAFSLCRGRGKAAPPVVEQGLDALDTVGLGIGTDTRQVRYHFAI
jgi:hypothetical protein